VTTLPFRPKLTLLELENVTADRLLDVVPADTFTADKRFVITGVVYDAVSTLELDSPKLMPLLLANETVPDVAVCVPATIATMSTSLNVTLAVTTDPLRPNETLFALPKVTALRLFDVVPADTFTAESSPAVLGCV